MVNKQLQYTYCPIFLEVKAARQWNLGNKYNRRNNFPKK